MLMAFIYVCKIMKIHHQNKTFGYINNIYFNFFKKINKVYSDFKYQAYKFSNKFNIGIVYVFKIGIIKITYKKFR
jgi:hypothetical protein